MSKLIGVFILFFLFSFSINTEKTIKPVKKVNHFDQYDDIILENAKKTGITPYLIKAIIYCESYMVYNTNRYESHLRTAEWYTNLIPDEYKSNKLSYTSVGLMQILPGIAWLVGYKGPPEGLYDPKVNIYFGVKHLLNIIRGYRYQARVVSVWNGGHLSRKKDGTYKNQKYVDNVVRKYKKYKLEGINAI